MTHQDALAVSRGATLILALSRLSEKQRAVIVRRYWHGDTLDEAAQTIGVSRARAWQLEQRATLMLAKGLEPYRELLAA